MSTPNENAPVSVQASEASNVTSSAEMVFPPAESVKGRVLGALLRGERLTHLDCWRRFGSSRLSHHVYCARRAGWPVKIVEEEVKTSDADRTATIGIYWLDDSDIEQAGELGQRYAAETLRIEHERRAS